MIQFSVVCDCDRSRYKETTGFRRDFICLRPRIIFQKDSRTAAQTSTKRDGNNAAHRHIVLAPLTGTLNSRRVISRMRLTRAPPVVKEDTHSATSTAPTIFFSNESSN